MTPAIILLALVTLERIGELFLARRNTAALIAKGAFEIAPAHYGLIVIFHAVWLAGLWFLVPYAPITGFWLAIFLVLQGLRVWVLRTLGPRWTTRIIILPGAPLVTKGPYRWFSHPNYMVVIGEIAVLPLCFGLIFYALAFSLGNAMLLVVRIRAENAALAGLRNGAGI